MQIVFILHINEQFRYVELECYILQLVTSTVWYLVFKLAGFFSFQGTVCSIPIVCPAWQGHSNCARTDRYERKTKKCANCCSNSQNSVLKAKATIGQMASKLEHYVSGHLCLFCKYELLDFYRRKLKSYLQSVKAGKISKPFSIRF